MPEPITIVIDGPLPDHVADYLTPDEVRAHRVYMETYRREYNRLHNPKQADDPRYRRYWSDLAHRIADRARSRIKP